ncbi:MAG: cupin domain-containing protein [Pseudanabaena sp. ELA607]
MKPLAKDNSITPNPANFFSLPHPLPIDETFLPIIHTSQILIEKIISVGHTTPADQWYDQDRDEWVMLLQGNATLAFEDGTMTDLAQGDYLLIPAHCRHRVIATSHEPHCIWLAVHGKLQA